MWQSRVTPLSITAWCNQTLLCYVAAPCSDISDSKLLSLWPMSLFCLDWFAHSTPDLQESKKIQAEFISQQKLQESLINRLRYYYMITTNAT
jgi:hypothetical protein